MTREWTIAYVISHYVYGLCVNLADKVSPFGNPKDVSAYPKVLITYICSLMLLRVISTMSARDYHYCIFVTVS